MKKQNVIDLAAYRETLHPEPDVDITHSEPTTDTISEELKSAIQTLIERLRSQNQRR